MAPRLRGTIELLDFDAFITARGLCYESYTYITRILQYFSVCFSALLLSGLRRPGRSLSQQSCTAATGKKNAPSACAGRARSCNTSARLQQHLQGGDKGSRTGPGPTCQARNQSQKSSKSTGKAKVGEGDSAEGWTEPDQDQTRAGPEPQQRSEFTSPATGSIWSCRKSSGRLTSWLLMSQ